MTQWCVLPGFWFPEHLPLYANRGSRPLIDTVPKHSANGKKERVDLCLFSFLETDGGWRFKSTNAANYHLSQPWLWFQKLRVAASISELQRSALLSPSVSWCVCVWKPLLSWMYHPGTQGVAAPVSVVKGKLKSFCVCSAALFSMNEPQE